MGREKRSIIEWNLRFFYASETCRALIFHIPVWVAFELQYITLAQLPLIEAVILGTQLFLELPTGALADLIGKRWTVAVGSFLGALSLLVYAQATNFSMFLLYAVILGIGESLISGAKEALIYDTLKQEGKEKEFSVVMSKVTLVFQITLAIGIVTGGILGSFSYVLAIYASFIASTLSVIFCMFFHEPSVDSKKFTIPLYIAQTREGFHEVFRTPYIRDVSFFYILVGGVTWVCNLVFNMTILTEKGFSTAQLGVMMAIVRIFNSVVLFRGLHIGTLFTKSRTFLMFPIVMAICLLPGVFYTNWMAVVAVTGILFCSTSRWVILGKYTNDEFSSKNRATAISTLSMAIGILYVGTTLLSGPIMQWYGGAGIIFTILGIVTILFILPLGIRLHKIHS